MSAGHGRRRSIRTASTTRGSLALSIMEDAHPPRWRWCWRSALAWRPAAPPARRRPRRRRAAAAATGGPRPIPASAFTDHTGITSTSVRSATCPRSRPASSRAPRSAPRPTSTTSTRPAGSTGASSSSTTPTTASPAPANKQATQNALQNDFALVGELLARGQLRRGASWPQNPGFPDVSQVLDSATNKLPNVVQPGPAGRRLGVGPDPVLQEPVHPRRRTPWARWWPTRPRPPRPGRGEVRRGEGGYKFVYEQTYATTQTDFNQQVIAMKNAGVKIIFMDQMPVELRLARCSRP